MQSYKITRPNLPGSLYLIFTLAALSVSFLLLSSLRQKAVGVYEPRQVIVWMALLTPLLFAGLIVGERLLHTRLAGVPRGDLFFVFTVSLLLGALLAWWFPPPVPALRHAHSLVLTSTGQHNPASGGATIEVKDLHASDGSPIPLDSLQLDGDWRLVKDNLVSDGSQPGSTATLSGALPDQIAVRLNYRPQAGQLLITWDGQPNQIDLYWKWPVGGTLTFGTSAWQAATSVQRVLLVGAGLLYVLGLAALWFGLAVIVRLRLFPPRLESAFLLLICLLIFLQYVNFKSAYARFNAERAYTDTLTYLLTADRPLSDINFWFSDRTFSLPLLYKAAGMTSANFTEQAVMQRVGDYQMWLSTAGWTLLALAVAGSLRQRWLAPFAFTTILFFSLSLEISMWDRLMLSEALSYALLTALLALWIWLETLPPAWRGGLPRALHLAALAAVTILFSFTRDTNLYFLLAAAAVMAAAALLKRSAPHNRGFYLCYAGVIVGLFVFQNLTVRLGNRWQVHVNDNLVARALHDEQMLDYFVEHGLPISQKFLDLKGTAVTEYQNALSYGLEPEFAAVREWVLHGGQSIYMRYLLAHPERALGDPLRNFGTLINGNNAEYRYPAFPEQPVPADVAGRDAKLYTRKPLTLAAIFLLVSGGCLVYWLGKGQAHPAWLALTVLFVSIPLLSFMVWNASPLEIERHAIQIGAQFRLAGWIALALALDWAGDRLARPVPETPPPSP